jgi:hypothetical protein
MSACNLRNYYSIKQKSGKNTFVNGHFRGFKYAYQGNLVYLCRNL